MQGERHKAKGESGLPPEKKIQTSGQRRPVSFAFRLVPLPFLCLLPLLGGSGLIGCRRSAPSVPQYTVRLDPLLPLHPLWGQVATLDDIQARLNTPATALQAMEWEARPLPPAFAVPEIIPPDLARERQKRIEADANRYVEQLEEFLRQRDEDVFARVERSERKAMEARLAEELANRIEELRESNKKQADTLSNQIRLLQFRDVPFQSQIRTFKGQPLQDAQIQHRQLLARIAALSERRDALLADVRPQAEKEMQPRREQALAELQEKLRRRREESAQKIAAALERARERLRAEAEAIPPLEQVAQSLALPPVSSAVSPLPPASSVFLPARTKMEAVQRQQSAHIMTQRERLLAAIREDTRNAVLQVAHQEGWQLRETGAAGIADHTEAVAETLKTQWKPAMP